MDAVWGAEKETAHGSSFADLTPLAGLSGMGTVPTTGVVGYDMTPLRAKKSGGSSLYIVCLASAMESGAEARLVLSAFGMTEVMP